MKLEKLLGSVRDELLPIFRYRPAGQEIYYQRYADAIEAIQQSGAGNHKETLLAESQRVHDAEGSRRESLNTRAGVLVGVIGVIGSLVVAAVSLTLTNKNNVSGSAVDLVLAFFILSLVYLTLSLVQALQVQGDWQGAVIDPTDLQPKNHETHDGDSYAVRVAAAHLRYTVYDYKLNNRIKFRLLCSQRCLRNGVVAIIIAGIASPWAIGTLAG
jgi:hypothetical protein